MNKDTAKDYLPLVQALAEGKTIQKFSDGDGWEDVRSPSFESPAKLYRIKPEPKKGWYRVGLFSHQLGCNPLGIVQCDSEEQRYEECRQFVRWLTDRIEYTLPECYA